jgi:hypothetical protein
LAAIDLNHSLPSNSTKESVARLRAGYRASGVRQ